MMLNDDKGYWTSGKKLTMCEAARQVYDICFAEWREAKPELLQEIKLLLDGVIIMSQVLVKRMANSGIEHKDIYPDNPKDLETIKQLREWRKQIESTS